MLAECYYQTSDDKALLLVLLSKSQCLSGFEDLSECDRNGLSGQQFNGALGAFAILHDHEGKICKIYVGAGDGNDKALALASVVNKLPSGHYVVAESLTQEAMVTWSLAQYKFDKYQAKQTAIRTLAVPKTALNETVAEAAAVFLVRDLINTPTNDLGPNELAAVVLQLAKQFGGQFTQWVGAELLRENFGAIHAVGRAAIAAPRLLSLVWGQEHHPRVTLVGKGVCFDSGGLNIKPAAGMRLMKKDMGGAAQVIGLAQWLMTHQVPIRLHVLIPAVENAIGSDSYRPGDVITMRNGMKVEIHDTDAEGRLVLADALVKACEDKPDLLIDFATLTGAARVAVGTEIAAMFVNDDALAQSLTEAAKEIKDPVWRMPLFPGYDDMFDSNIADFSNASASSYAGAITAALFLQRFLPKDLPWAHFDIMAWNVGNKPGRPEGGEAMGMRAVGRYLMQRFAAAAGKECASNSP